MSPIPTFAPIRGPSFESPIQAEYRTDRQSSHAGYEISRPLGLASLDGIQLRWQSLRTPEFHDIKSFFDGLQGTGPFYYTPTDPLTAPGGMTPELSEVAGGSLTGQGTYYVQFTWYDPTTGLETTPSRETSLAVSDNNLLVVKVPVFPLGVEAWRVYVGASQGAAELQSGSSTARTWTMPATGRETGGASPPTENNMKVPRIFSRGSNLVFTPVAPQVYDAQLTLLEQTAAPP